MVSIDDLTTIEGVETVIGIAHVTGIEIEVIHMVAARTGAMMVVADIGAEAVVDKAPTEEVHAVRQSQVELSCSIESGFLVWKI